MMLTPPGRDDKDRLPCLRDGLLPTGRGDMMNATGIAEPGSVVNVMRLSWWHTTEMNGGAVAWLRGGCALALAVVCGLPAVPAEQDAQSDANAKVLVAAGIKPTGAGIGAYLKRFTPSADHAKRVAGLIKDLAAEEFNVRERATKALAALPVFPREALEKAALSDDLEVSARAKRLLAHGQAQGKRTLLAALAVVAKRKIKHLAAEVLAAGAHCPQSERPRAVTEALVATVALADAGMLRRALRSEAAWTRSAAASPPHSITTTWRWAARWAASIPTPMTRTAT